MSFTDILNNDVVQLNKEKHKVNPVIYPIITSSTYKISDINNIDNELYTYSRSDNPTRKLLETNLAILEKAKYGLSFSSGLGVLTCLSHLDIFNKGVIASHDLYGGTKRFFNEVLSKEIKYLDFKFKLYLQGFSIKV